ncbi:MAG: glycosyltransferase family 2 protein [Bifidobacteriaceae bacterium]|jgi:glycosyltransferase involved in cell wall biosynthesis|nr:glycosyltransferase family 2 protein [Bifidobacteriaceae bacterium]
MAASEFDDLWVIVPAFDEARVLGRVLEELVEVFPHVCVVDDCSRDASAAIARGFAGRGVRLVAHPVNLGQGAALQTGFEYVLADPLMARVVTFDADGQHSVDDAVRLARHLGDGFDVVLGSRFLPPAPPAATPQAPGEVPAAAAESMGRVKRLVLRLAVAYTRCSTRLRLTDTHNGLRAMSRSAVAAMKLTQEGMAHATEILERIRRQRLRYTEEPVEIRYSEYSKSKGQSLLNSVNILVDLLVR